MSWPMGIAAYMLAGALLASSTAIPNVVTHSPSVHSKFMSRERVAAAESHGFHSHAEVVMGSALAITFWRQRLASSGR